MTIRVVEKGLTALLALGLLAGYWRYRKEFLA